jgi:death on curing protein
MPPIFLALDEVIDIHRDQLERYGGEPGIRDFGLLQSALAMPATSFGGEYLHATLAEMAAAYLFHIVMNHPFVDGNKRTGTVAAIVFLELNGLSLNTDEDELADFVLDVAQGKVDKTGIAAFISTHAK